MTDNRVLRKEKLQSLWKPIVPADQQTTSWNTSSWRKQVHLQEVNGCTRSRVELVCRAWAQPLNSLKSLPLRPDASAFGSLFVRVELLNDVPSFLRCFSVLKQVQVAILNDPFVGQELEVDDSVPVLLAVQDDWNVLHATGLFKR